MARVAYRTLFPLASGGMGTVEVVLRSQQSVDRVCARKRLLPHLRGDEQYRAMFLDEARLASALVHQNIVAVLDVGEDADGPFLVMEHVQGVSAARLIEEANARGEQLPLQVALRIALEAAHGLHAAHEARDESGSPLGVVHRDVSPLNLLVGYTGAVKVTDFGIAKAIGNSSQTTTGVLKGNIGYLAPEVLRFEPADRRSDLFSLGVTLYELLTGRRLYAANDDGARRILHAPPPDLLGARPDAPPELVELMFDLLAKDPQHRPGTANEVAGRIEAVVAQVIAREGPYTLAEYLAEHFADGRAQSDARLADAIQALRRRARQRRWLPWVPAGAAAVAAMLGLWRWHAGADAETVGLLEAGGYHTCAQEGTQLYCWGKNSDGQAGYGGTLDSAIRRPVSLPPVAALGLGLLHTCACTGDGRAFCWGRNEDGQLGIGRAGAPVPTPSQVPGVESCRAISGGSKHTCAVRADGAVLCWGRNDQRQSSPVEADRVLTPQLRDDVRGALSIAAGGGFACALLGSGRVQCWGNNSNGNLGDGTRTDRPHAQVVAGLDDVVEVRASEWSTCARRRDGRLSCWGRWTSSERDDRDFLVPTPIPGVDDAHQIAMGINHACALRATGDVVCFGLNGFGQLGMSGPGRPPEMPVPVPSLAGVQRLASGIAHVCARHATGIACWGLNQTGQLGDGFHLDRSSPVSVSGFGAPSL